MRRDVIVKLGSESAQRGEARPRYRREVVVLVMVADLRSIDDKRRDARSQAKITYIVSEDVQRPIVAVRLLFKAIP